MVLKVKVSPDLIAGDVNEGYGKVADVFRRNLTSGQEVGAAVAVYRDGVKVVDLWGGFRNGITRARWQEDTLVPTFSRPPKVFPHSRWLNQKMRPGERLGLGFSIARRRKIRRAGQAAPGNLRRSAAATGRSWR